MLTVAYHATVYKPNVAVTGIAIRTPERRVYFRDDATETWLELYDTDASTLHLHGRVDVAQAQAIADGNPVIKASRTLTRRQA